jgi:ribosome biogenesis GTPase / thiamine phosphate phosphatase
MHTRRLRGLQTNNHDLQPESGFVCLYCGRPVTPNPAGTEHRNHCPWCLRSIHVDNAPPDGGLPGDRASKCGGLTEPVAISVRRDKEWVIIHRCNDCGALRENRIAGDDNALALLSLAVRPMARPPFPLDGLMEK